jgi:hypothetical protein
LFTSAAYEPPFEIFSFLPLYVPVDENAWQHVLLYMLEILLYAYDKPYVR